MHNWTKSLLPFSFPFSCYENTVLRWLASPTFSKNMKSYKVETRKEMIIIQQDPTNSRQCNSIRLGSYNEEAGSHEHSFHLHIHVQGKLDAKVVCVCEDFLQETTPLLADTTNGLVTIFPLQLQSMNDMNDRVEPKFM